MELSQRACLLAASLLIGLVSCDSGTSIQETSPAQAANHQAPIRNQSIGKKMNVKIGSKTFTATLEDNPAVTKLKTLLPLSLDMSELNGNEKYADLSAQLPKDATNPGTIQNGDLMLYESNTFVLFYKSFRTSYSYTRLGRIDDPKGLAEAVGKEGVTVTFELE